MMAVQNPQDTDPYAIDPVAYLEDLKLEDLSPTKCLEHYRVLKPSVARLQTEDPPAFDLVVKDLVKKFGFKAKTVRDDLASLVEPPAVKEARDLLDKIGPTRSLRLAQDYQDGKLWFGVMAGDDKLLVNSDRELLTLDKAPADLTVKDGGFDLCRFSKGGILRFLGGDKESGNELLNDLRAFFLRFAVFRDKRIALLLAVWTLGTYCYRIFRIFAYLALRSPAKRCGKSRILDLLSLLAFNASPKTVHPTEAQLFRGPSSNGGTLLLDEVEALGKIDNNAYKGLLSVLNNGFEQNGIVQRHEKDANGNYRPVNFETFCPRAIAGINKTADTLEDRSIIIVMQRRLKSEKTDRFSSSRCEDEAQVLRDRCYLWTLTHAEDLADVYDKADRSFSALDSLDDRARDLWEPLVSVTAVADVERGDGQKTLTDDLMALAHDLCQVREGAAEDSTTVQVLRALQAIVALKRQEAPTKNTEAITVKPTDLASLLREKLGWEKLSTKLLANLLNPLGLYSKSTRIEGEIPHMYHLSEVTLLELGERYTPSEAGKEREK